MTKWKNKLQGGDLRSIGRVNEIVKEITDQKEFDELFIELFSDDRKTVMRAADAIEKITLRNPEYLSAHKKDLLGLCKTSENIELKWHLALLIARLELSKKEKAAVWELLMSWARDQEESRIVRVNAVQALYEISGSEPGSREKFLQLADDLRKEGIPSLNARIRKLKIRKGENDAR